MISRLKNGGAQERRGGGGTEISRAYYVKFNSQIK